MHKEAFEQHANCFIRMAGAMANYDFCGTLALADIFPQMQALLLLQEDWYRKMQAAIENHVQAKSLPNL